MKTLMIIAAGLGTRMGVSVPKALAEVNGKPNIEHTIEHAVPVYGTNIFVVANKKAKDAWVNWQRNTDADVELMFIDSGLGDGHAVLAAVEAVWTELNYILPAEITIMWGDAHVNSPHIFSELENQELGTNSGVFPVVMEQNPYVTALVDEQMQVTHIDFSKRGEKHETGFHDQSIFRFKTGAMHAALRFMHKVLWKGGRYISEGGELNFLHVVHFLYNSDHPVKIYQTKYPLMSYNTPDELMKIQIKV